MTTTTDKQHVMYEGTSVNGSGQALWLDVIHAVNGLCAEGEEVFDGVTIVPGTSVTPYTEVYSGADNVAHAIVTFKDETVDGQEGQRVQVISLTDDVDRLMTQALTNLALPLERV